MSGKKDVEATAKAQEPGSVGLCPGRGYLRQDGGPDRILRFRGCGFVHRSRKHWPHEDRLMDPMTERELGTNREGLRSGMSRENQCVSRRQLTGGGQLGQHRADLLL